MGLRGGKGGVTIKISGDASGYETAVAGVKKTTKELDAELASIAKVSAIAFAALAGSAALTVRAFADFDNRLRSVKTLLDESSFGAQGLEKGFSKMSDELLQLSVNSGQALDVLSKGLFDTVSAGIDAGKSVEFLGVASRLAIAGVTDVSVATDGLTTAINAYGLSADDANLVAAKFFTAQKRGSTTVAELAKGFGVVASTAKETGVSMNELFAATSAATLAGIDTSKAYTSLNAILANVAKPTADAAAEAKKLGVEFNLASLRSKGLQVFLKDLTKSANFNKDSVTRLFGSVEAMNLAFALTGSQAESFTSILEELGDETKSLETINNAFNEQAGSLENQMNRLTQQFVVLAIEVGEELAPAVEFAADAIKTFFDLVSEDGSLKDFAGTLATIITLLLGSTGLVASLSIGAIAIKKFSAGLVIAKSAANTLRTALVSARLAAIALSTLGIGILIAAIAAVIEVTSASTDEFDAMAAAQGGATVTSKELADQITRLEQEQKKLNVEDRKRLFLGNSQVQTSADLIKVNKQLIEVKKQLASVLEFEAEQARKVQEERERQILADSERKGVEFEEELARRQALRELADEENKLDKEQRDEKFNQILEDNITLEVELEGLDKDAREKRIQAIREQIETEVSIRRKAAGIRVKDQSKSDARFLDQQEKFGTVVAVIDQVVNNSRVNAARAAFGALASLAKSKNAELKAIGKAAAIAQITIDTARGALSVYTNFQTAIPFPPVSIPLGLAAAAAFTAFGVERAANVVAARRGGIVPGGGADVDRVPALLSPGELITPRKSFDEVISAVANERARRMAENQAPSGGDVESQVSSLGGILEIRFADNAIGMIEAELIERDKLNLSQEFS